jgi:hypothetical protein
MTEKTLGQIATEAWEPLVPCPLCGEDKGYKLHEGCTYKWISVQCGACGQEVAESRATYPINTGTDMVNAHIAWNAAGAHAAGLRVKIAALEAVANVVRKQTAAECAEICEDLPVGAIWRGNVSAHEAAALACEAAIKKAFGLDATEVKE